MKLRPYQEKCLQASELAQANGITRQLWVLATGLGKTVLISAYLQRHGCTGTLGLMHREELLQQSAEKIAVFNPEARVEIEKASARADRDSSSEVILASVQTVGREGSNRLPPKDWLKTLWIDEAHHSPADGYLRVCSHFGLRSENAETPIRKDAMLIGTTATPDRLDGLGYASLFDDVTFRYDLPDAIRDGWLADVKAWRVENDLSLRGVRTTAGDYAQGELAAAIEKSNLTARAVQTWEEHGRGKSSIFFCVDKEHAASTREALEGVGAIARVVTDQTPASERKQIIAAYQAGEIECLVNCAVFTEGFDSPRTNAIYMLRPTKSRGLYMQCIGRGTRKAPGKDHVEVFDFTPKGQPAANVANIFELPDAWELAGQSLIKDSEEFAGIQEELPLDLSQITSLAELKTTKRRIQLFRSSLFTDAIPGSTMTWMRGSNDTVQLSWRNPTLEQVSKLPLYLKERYTNYPLLDQHLVGSRESFAVKQNELGQWELFYSRLGTCTKMTPSHPTQRRAISEAEEFVFRHRSYVVPLLSAKGAWRKDPASDLQKKALKRKGVPNEMLAIATKAEAASLMDMGLHEIEHLFGGAR